MLLRVTHAAGALSHRVNWYGFTGEYTTWCCVILRCSLHLSINLISQTARDMMQHRGLYTLTLLRHSIVLDQLGLTSDSRAMMVLAEPLIPTEDEARFGLFEEGLSFLFF